jgi:hypothetical protein
MGKAHQNQKKRTAQPKSETNALVTWKKITLSIGSKLLYKEVLKPIWTYGIQIWGTASNFNMKSSNAFNPRLSNPF